MSTLSIPIMFSIIFLFSALIYISMGVYILSRNVRSTLNRLFFLICCSLTAWAYAYALAHSAPYHEMALFWHRMSSLGWGTIYSITLHFFLVLTQRTRLLKHYLTYVLLYAPALATLILFGPLGSLAEGQYQLMYLEAGWIDVSVPGISERFFEAYFLLYSSLSLITLWTWEQSRANSANRITVRLISTAYLATLAISTLTDLVFRPTLAMPIPQVGILIAIITVTAFFYATIKQGFMGRPKKGPVVQGHILSETNRVRMYQLLALTFALGSYLNMGGYFFREEPLARATLFSGAMFCCSIILFLLPQASLTRKEQDNLLVTIIAAFYPLMMLYYLESGTSNILWPAPLLFILISAIFNNQRLLVMITLSSVLTQLWLWILLPEQIVHIQTGDHHTRLIFYLFGGLLAYYVNRVYVRRLTENEVQTSLQRMIACISASLVGVNPENLGEKLNQLLEQAGRHFEVDRSYIFLVSEDQSTCTYAYEWCKEGIEPALEQVGTLPTATFPWWMEQLSQNQAVHIPDVTKLPPEATAEQDLLENQQIKSLLAIPIMNNKQLQGFMGFDSVRVFKEWEEGHREALGILTNLASDALVKIKNEENINYMAYYDSLTGLANRALFNNRLEQAITLAQRQEKYLGLLYIDLDTFKAVNDTIGHEGGDKLLVQVAEKLSQQVRQPDTICRFGGDEFLILFNQVEQLKDIQAAAKKVIQLFYEPMIVQGQEFFITASGGISVYPEDGTEVDSLVKNADLAMATAKIQGKNKVVFCNPVMKGAVAERIQLTNHLYRALQRKELTLHYQPQINIATRKIVGIEALVRWQHPAKGMLSPGLFIPLAEQTGLINPIGRWVLETACRQNKTWQDKDLPPLTMAVNLSVEQFKNPKLVDTVAQVLEETRLDSRWLELEITEATAMQGADYIIPVLHQLKDLGVAISIDDFGTKYSSLSRLKAIPADRIKMAMEFVHGITIGRKDKAVAQVIINLAKSLGLRVIAEGVETEHQLSILAEQVCDEVQGYYFYKPMPASQVESLIGKEV